MMKVQLFQGTARWVLLTAYKTQSLWCTWIGPDAEISSFLNQRKQRVVVNGLILCGMMRQVVYLKAAF